MKSPLILAAILTVSACAPMATGDQYRPIVDHGVGPQSYESDLAECQQYAKSRPSAAEGVVIGAILGALLGAAMAPSGRYQRDLAGYGAGLGGISGAAQAEGDQRNIIRKCMAGRGYNVLL